jgi:hypothetical protein
MADKARKVLFRGVAREVLLMKDSAASRPPRQTLRSRLLCAHLPVTLDHVLSGGKLNGINAD